MSDRVIIDFTWDNSTNTEYQWIVNGNTYPPTRQVDNVDRSAQVGSLDSRYASPTVTTAVAITFTASYTLPAGISIIEYKWNFGDGQSGYGPVVAHTYLQAPSQTQVSLSVVDSNRQVWSRSKVLRLRFANRITVSGNNVKNA